VILPNEPKRMTPLTMDVARELTSRLTGSRLTTAKRREHDWAFEFGKDVGVRVSCTWRILVDGRMKFAGDDDGQQFGLPNPLDGEEEATRLLGQRSIKNLTIRPDTGDLCIVFDGGATLEFINDSSGYEGWELHAGGLAVIALGGGGLAVMNLPK